MKKINLNIIKVFLGVLILGLLFYKVNFSKIYDALIMIKVYWILAIVLLFILSQFIIAVNINLLLKAIKFRASIVQIFKYVWISNMLSLIIPGRVGDFSTALFLKKRKLKIGKGLAVMTMDKLITFFWLMAFVILGFSIFFTGYDTLKVVFIFLLMIIGVAAASTKMFRNLVNRFVLRKYAGKFSGFSDTFFSYFKRHHGVVLLNSFMTIIRLGINALIAFLIFLSLGKVVDICVVFVIVCIETIASIIPITPGGIGIKQSIGVYLFGLAGVGASIVAARYVIDLLIWYAAGLLTVIFVRRKDYG